MNIIHHQILKKYTIALLDTFNNINLPVYSKKGKLLREIKVPITFGNKDKVYRIHNTNENLKAGNNNQLPRMALSFNGLSKASHRDTSKYTKINLHSKEDSNKMVSFQFNSVAYDFQFTLHIASKTLTEMMFITESITPLFRPTYTIPVYELDIQQEPTNIILELSSVDLQIPEDLGEEDLRIIMCDIPLNLRGNMYLPVTDEKLITKMRLYLNQKIEDDLQHALLMYNLEADNSGFLNEFETENTAFINQARKNEGNKGWA